MNRKYQMIIVTADPSIKTLMSSVLNRVNLESELKYVSTLTEFHELLKASKPDLVIADKECATLDSVAVRDEIRMLGSLIPIIVVSSRAPEPGGADLRKKGTVEFIAARDTTGLSSSILKHLTNANKDRSNSDRLSGEKDENTLIREWKERYELIVASTNQLVYDYNTRDGSIDWSGNSIGVTGFNLSEMNGGIKQWTEMIHPSDRDLAINLLDKAEHDQTSYNVEYRFRHKTKEYVWLHDKGFFMYDVNGKAVRMLGMMENISARKEAEEELYESRQMIQLVLDHIPQRVFWKDRNYRYLGCNKSFLRDAGLSDISEILGKEDFELNWKDTAPLYRADDRMVMETKKPKLNYEEPQYRTDGSSSWLRTSKVPLLDKEGRVFAVLGMYEDITDQKKMELALRESEIKYRELIDKSLVGIYITQDHILKFCNKRFAEIFGFSQPEDLLGIHVKSLIADESWDTVDTQVKLRESGKLESAQYEFKGKRKDGSLIDLEVLGIRILYKGTPAVQGSLIDITDKTVFQKQMLRSQRLESLGTLAGGIAHDLNNVLSPILLSIEILKKQLSDEKSLHILNTLNNSATRGREIIKQILTFARGLSGEQVVIQPLHIIRELEHIIRETFPKSIGYRSKLEKNLWTIQADPTQIHQVLLNVGINARDAMPHGGTMKIYAENVNLGMENIQTGKIIKPGPYVKIAIEDTGTGIPPEILDKIFEPFFTTKERGKGTGLGLSTVQSIVRSHNGFTTVNSEIGKGTTFAIYLPAAEEIKIHTGQEILKIPQGKGETILVVDDEQSILDITKNTLEMYGYRVLTARDGIEALSIYTRESETIDVVLTDLIMPSLGGMTTAHSLRKMNPNVKIITSSGIKIEENDSGALGTENHIFLQKPYSAEKLLTTIQEIISGKSTHN